MLLLDHRDSFVYLLADQFARLGVDVDVVRDGVTQAAWQRCLERANPDLVVLSPGPGHPRDAELAGSWLATGPTVPVFGVCLGHQVIALSAGQSVVRADQPVHGEASEIEWHEQPFAQLLPAHMPVARYHSLVVASPQSGAAFEGAVPLRVLASADQGGERVVMAIEHTELPQIGVQFHPESVLTPNGQDLLRRVLLWAIERREAKQNLLTNKMSEVTE